MAPKIAIIIYTLHHHIARLAEEEARGIRNAGGEVTIFQVPETLTGEALEKASKDAPPRPSYPTITPQELPQFDAFLFGIPTRYGNFPVQWKSFIDSTVGLWLGGELYGKYVGVFVSTSTQGGGQEVTASNAMSTFVHHGMIFVPLGYKNAFNILADVSEVRGGSPWGAGTFSGAGNDRKLTANELQLAQIQGKTFFETVSRVNF